MNWNAGYVTDVAYTVGYHVEQSPGHLTLASLLCGIMPATVRRPHRGTYLELGSGRGFGALCLAASNPGWQVIGIDFMPAHIDEAREIADAARISNVQFIEADIATLDPMSLPEIDVASAHGVWSWVADTVREGMVRILAERLRPGGLAHVSYNALPAWQSALGLQRLMYEAGQQGSGRSDRMASDAAGLAEALAKTGAIHLGETSLLKVLLRDLPNMPSAYLAHEYMNAAWRPCFHPDVAAALGGAKLDYVGSADLLENFPDLMLTPEQRAISDRVEDRALRELVKDLCLPRGLRHDIFVRGPRRINDLARDAALRDVQVTLKRLPEAFTYGAGVPAGNAAMERAFYEPMVMALAERPQRIGDLLSLPAVSGRQGTAAELVGMLVGTGQALLVANPEEAAGDAAQRLNDVIAQRLLDGRQERAGALATARLGAGMLCSTEEHVTAYCLRRFGPATEPEQWADALHLPDGSEARTRFLTMATTALRQLPVWQNAAVI
jgi:Predicted methyltransferase regulatory domain/Methyltransferase domain